MEAFFIAVGAVVFTLAFVTVLAILRGWVLSILWGWFIVPFFGLPVLNIPYAIGIALVISYLTVSSSKKNDDIDYWRSTATPLFALLIGWIVTWFI